MKILAADLWPGLSFAPNERYQMFMSIGRPRVAAFIESVLLYDQVLVPTDDFMSAAILIGALGQAAVTDLLDHEVLRFIRYRGTFGYAGSGGTVHGLVGLEAYPSNMEVFVDTDRAINWALSSLNLSSDITALADRILHSTQEIRMNAILGAVAEKTYSTIATSSELMMALTKAGDLSRLAGVKPQDIRLYGGLGDEIRTDAGDEIDQLLGIARCHVERYAALEARCEDIRTQTNIGQVLAASSSASFGVLGEVADVPDVGELFLRGGLDTKDLIKLRQNRDWKPFIKWFHENCRKQPMEAAKAYIKLISDKPLIDSVPAKCMRFVAELGIGLWNPIAGALVSAADMFAADRLRSSSPKYFIERLEQLAKAQREMHSGED